MTAEIQTSDLNDFFFIIRLRRRTFWHKIIIHWPMSFFIFFRGCVCVLLIIVITVRSWKIFLSLQNSDTWQIFQSFNLRSFGLFMFLSKSFFERSNALSGMVARVSNTSYATRSGHQCPTYAYK